MRIQAGYDRHGLIAEQADIGDVFEKSGEVLIMNHIKDNSIKSCSQEL